MLEYTQNTDWTVFVSGCNNTSRMQTGMFLSVKVVVFSRVFFRMLEHVQHADWNVFVSFFSSCFFEAVRTCPEWRLECFRQSSFSLTFL